jgi:hypothetical protein
MNALVILGLALAGQASRGDTMKVELGFPGLPRLSYHRTFDSTLSVGGAIAFGYAYFAPSDSFGSAVVLSMPVKKTIVDDGLFRFAVRGEPGLYLGIAQPEFSQAIPGLVLGTGLAASWLYDRDLELGGGIDMPLMIGFPTGGRDVFIAVPLLIGPTAEYRATYDLTLSVDAKIGPHFMTDDFYGTRFGMRIFLGAAYRL